MTSTKYRISKKVLSSMPAEVATVIARIAADYNETGIKSFSYEQVPAGSMHYFMEGDRTTVIYNGEEMSVEMVAEHNIGAANVHHNIGDRVPMPVGAVVITIYYTYSSSGYAMRVKNVGMPAMEDMGKVQPAQIPARV